MSAWSTPEQRQAAVDRAAEIGIPAAAEEAGRPYVTVYGWCKQMEVTPRRMPPGPSRGQEDRLRDVEIAALYPAMTMAEIGKRYGFSRERARQILKRAGLTGAQDRASRPLRWSKVRPVIALSRAWKRGGPQAPTPAAAGKWRQRWGERLFPLRRPRLRPAQVKALSVAWLDGTLKTALGGYTAGSWRAGHPILPSAIFQLRRQHGEEMFPLRRSRHG